MDAVTYPNDKVAAYVQDNVIPLRIGHEQQPFAEQFKVKWTPRLFILDANGNPDHDVIGFLPPDELVPFIQLGQAKKAFHSDQLDQAIDILDSLLLESSACGSAPEAVFLRGVSHFKKNEDPKALKEVYRLLMFDYPHSAWARRGFPYWNL